MNIGSSTLKDTQHPQNSLEKKDTHLEIKKLPEASSSKTFLRKVTPVHHSKIVGTKRKQSSEESSSVLSERKIIKHKQTKDTEEYQPDAELFIDLLRKTQAYSKKISDDIQDDTSSVSGNSGKCRKSSIRFPYPAKVWKRDSSSGRLESSDLTTIVNRLADNLKKINLMDNITDCLESFMKNKIPDAFPDVSCLSDEDLEDHDFKEIKSLFISIYHPRSCVCLDKRFLSELSSFLNGKKCIEIYAGNGWLTDALKKRSINITATDNYSFTDLPEGHLNFMKEVTKQKASEAVEQFISTLSKDDQGRILLCFPAGSKSEILSIFSHFKNHSNFAIIAIGLNEEKWSIPANLFETFTKRDITEELKYTPSPLKERVIIYSSKIPSTQGTLTKTS